MLVVGLDLSLTDSGIVILDCRPASPVVIHRKSFKTSTDDGSDQYRVNLIVNYVLQKLVDSKYECANIVVVIENYSMGSRVGKSFTRSEIGGTIKYIISTVFGFPCYTVAPTSLKKFIHTGKATKSEMGFYCQAKFGFYDDNDNIVDAYCLTRYYLANRAGKKLAIVANPPYPAMRSLQVPAKLRVAQVLSRPLTKKLQPRNLTLARRIIR